MNYVNYDVDKNKYMLEKVCIFSRHNIRSPLSNGNNILNKVTNHSWFDWTSKAGELSLRGYELEKEIGNYFREYLISKGFIDKNYIPKDEEIRIYANSIQRTIETTRGFAKGLFPNNEIAVEHKKIDVFDPVFSAHINCSSDKFVKQVRKEAKQFCDSINLKNSYELLENVLNYSESKMAKSLPHLDPNDFSFRLETNKELILNDSLTIASAAADALKLQYYEDDDNFKASFYHDLSVQQWVELSRITDAYIYIKFGLPSISVNIASAALKEIYKELNNDKRKLTFLCGHDSNVLSILGALDVNDYNLPKTFEYKAPIGGAIVIEKWLDKITSQEYYSICMQYQTVYQLEEIANLDLNLTPVKYRLTFKGLEANKEGLYKAEDFDNRILNSLISYEELKKKC